MMSVIGLANREKTYLCTVVAPSVGLSASDCFFGPTFRGGMMFLHRSTLFFRVVRVHPPDCRTYLIVSIYKLIKTIITYDSGMITSSAFLTCTTLSSGFAAILIISFGPRRISVSLPGSCGPRDHTGSRSSYMDSRDVRGRPLYRM
jgi:hypothetical protein